MKIYILGIYVLSISFFFFNYSLAEDIYTPFEEYLTLYPEQTGVAKKLLLHYLIQQRESISIVETYRKQRVKKLLYHTWPTHTGFDDDTSITKIVTSSLGYENKLYTPPDLEPIEKTPYLTFGYIRNNNRHLRPPAHEALQSLSKAYTEHFSEALQLNAARRPYHEQQNRLFPGCLQAGICSRPGHSEHQNGYTIDIGNMRGLYYAWMQDHAHIYGFHQSYQTNKDNGGIIAEPRHRRYVGPTLATYLYENHLTIYEYRQKEQKE